MGDLGRHLDPPFVAPADLALDEEGHGVAQAQLALGGFVEQAVELIADGGQLQPGQHVGERLAVGVHDQVPPAACSYSDRGREPLGLDEGRRRRDRRLACRKRRPAQGGEAFQVGGDHRLLAATGDLAMAGDFAAAMADADPSAGHRHRHRLADQPPGHAIGIGVDLDRSVGLDPSDELAHRVVRRPAVERTKSGGLLANETRHRRFACGSMDTLIGDLAHPPVEMRLERGPTVEAAPGDRVVLHVADAALVLALGPRAVGRASARPETPVACKPMQPLVKSHLARRCVVVLDQRPGVVEQNLLRNPAEMAERPLHAVEPGRLSLMPEGAHKYSPRITERRHEQVQLHNLAADRGPRLAKVDLQLPPRRRLEAKRRPSLGGRLPSNT